MRLARRVKTSTRLLFAIFLTVTAITIMFFTVSPFTIQPVLSGSNSPAQELGDVIIIDRSIKASQLKIGDVIVYSPLNVKYHVIHRIINIKMFNGSYYFLVKGDFNRQPDLRDHHPPYQLNVLINFTTSNGNRHEIVGTWYHESLLVGKVVVTIPKIFWLLMPLFTSQIPPLLHIYLLLMMGTYIFYRYRLAKMQPYLLRRRLPRIPQASNDLQNHVKTLIFIIPTIFLFLLALYTSQTITFDETIIIDRQRTSFYSLDNTTNQVLTYLHRTELKSNQELIEINETTVTIEYEKINNTVGRMNIKEVGTRTSFTEEVAFEGKEYPILINHSYIIYLKTLLLISNHTTAPYQLQLFPYIIKHPITSNNESKEAAVKGFIVPVREESPSNKDDQTSTRTILGTDELNFVQDMLDQSFSLKARFDASTGLLLEMNVKLVARLYLAPLALDYMAFTLSPILMIKNTKTRFERELSEKIKVLEEIDELARQLRKQDEDDDQGRDENPN